MKEGCLHKLTITECSHQATQFKEIHNILPVLYADKGFKFVDNVICTNKGLIKTNHLQAYLDETLWSTIVNVKINTVDPTATPDAQTGACPIIKAVLKKTRVFGANMQKKLLSEYDLNYKIKSQEWAKLSANK